MRFTRLEDWLRWQESCHPSAIDLQLERVRKVADRLGLLRPEARIITIAGTNGKGSCAAAVEALLREVGQPCGVYSSPHILHYRERIKIAGEYACDEALCRAFAAIDAARGEISLTYFEFGTLAAFFLFAERQLPYWVLEVGLGGRLDATNILDPDVAVITSIALDHLDWLGPDRESIGREKAGICRPDVPLVCADPAPPQSVLRAAEQLPCPLYRIERDFGFRESAEGTAFWVGDAGSEPMAVQLPNPSLAAALQVIRLLGLGQDALPTEVLSTLTLPGRLQRFNLGKRLILMDVAHNPAALAYVALRLQGRACDLIVAMMADKNLPDSLAALLPIGRSWSLTTIADLPRAASADQLRQALPEHIEARTFMSVAAALDAVLRAPVAAPVLVTGSFHTVAEATRYLQLRGADEAAG